MPRPNANPGRRSVHRHGDPVTVVSERVERVYDEWDSDLRTEIRADTRALFTRPLAVDIERDAANTDRTVDYVVFLPSDITAEVETDAGIERVPVPIVDTAEADEENVRETRITRRGQTYRVILPQERLPGLIRVVVTRT